MRCIRLLAAGTVVLCALPAASNEKRTDDRNARSAGAQWRRRNVPITRDRAGYTEDSRSYREDPDFNPKSDKIAGYGLAALVAGTAAAAAVKLGFKALGGSDLRGQEVYHHQRDCDRGISSEAGLSESKHRHDYFRTASIIPRTSNLSLGD